MFLASVVDQLVELLDVDLLYQLIYLLIDWLVNLLTSQFN